MTVLGRTMHYKERAERTLTVSCTLTLNGELSRTDRQKKSKPSCGPSENETDTIDLMDKTCPLHRSAGILDLNSSLACPNELWQALVFAPSKYSKTHLPG